MKNPGLCHSVVSCVQRYAYFFILRASFFIIFCECVPFHQTDAFRQRPAQVFPLAHAFGQELYADGAYLLAADLLRRVHPAAGARQFEVERPQPVDVHRAPFVHELRHHRRQASQHQVDIARRGGAHAGDSGGYVFGGGGVSGEGHGAGKPLELISYFQSAFLEKHGFIFFECMVLCGPFASLPVVGRGSSDFHAILLTDGEYDEKGFFVANISLFRQIKKPFSSY